MTPHPDEERCLLRQVRGRRYCDAGNGRGGSAAAPRRPAEHRRPNEAWWFRELPAVSYPAKWRAAAWPVYPGLYSVVNGKQLCRLLVGVTGFLLAEPMEMLSHLRISCSIIQQKQSSIKHQKTVWQIYIRA